MFPRKEPVAPAAVPSPGTHLKIHDPTSDNPPAVAGLENSELQLLLDAWQDATKRLQTTHELLRQEVRTLTAELEIKNQQLAQKNRLADLGQMAAHVAHEVRNGLAPLTLYVSLLHRQFTENSRGLSIAGKIKSGLTALETIVNDLLHFTADREPHRRTFFLREQVAEGLAALQPQVTAQRITCEVDVPAELVMFADLNMIQRALHNLVLNALDVMPQGGELTIIACETDDAIEIEVSDSGPGIDGEKIERLFEPFYTTKSNGTGLGLTIVGRVAAAHGGTVTAMNCPQGGAAFTIVFPRRRAMEAAA